MSFNSNILISTFAIKSEGATRLTSTPVNSVQSLDITILRRDNREISDVAQLGTSNQKRRLKKYQYIRTIGLSVSINNLYNCTGSEKTELRFPHYLQNSGSDSLVVHSSWLGAPGIHRMIYMSLFPSFPFSSLQSILSRQTEQKGILNLYKPVGESSLSPCMSHATDTLTFLVGIYFIYGTALLIMKFSITPGRA